MNGSLHLMETDEGRKVWVIPTMKPHVAIRFKRMFGGIPEGQVPPFRLLDAPDRAVDLEWFMSRYPLELSPAASEMLVERLAEHASRNAAVEDLLAPGNKAAPITGLRPPEKAMPHQNRAAHLWRTRKRLLLLDEVGLGKTVTALGALADGHRLPAVIVVQPHLSGQWARYVKRFTNLTVFEVKDRKVRSLPPADIYIFRYSNVGSWGIYAETLGCRSLVLDEVQEIRHGQSTDKGRGCHAFASVTENVIGLTATPIYNYGSEIFSVIQVIEPGALGSWIEFTINWCRITSNGHYVVKDPPALGAYLSEMGLTLRRTQESEEVDSALPPLSKVVMEVAWNEGDAESDRDLQRNLAQRVLEGSFTQRGSAARELSLLLRHDTGVAKARAVAAYVRMLVESGEQVLLGGWHREVYRIWLDALKDHGIVLFTGSETQAAKNRARHAFISGDARVMAMSLRSGAGLDGLQHVAQHVVFGEFDWSPQVHHQFTGRLRRYGQTKPVTAHYLWADGGSDPVVMDVLGLKASQSRGIIDPFAANEEATPIDESHIKRLARDLLERAGE